MYADRANYNAADDGLEGAAMERARLHSGRGRGVRARVERYCAPPKFTRSPGRICTTWGTRVPLSERARARAEVAQVLPTLHHQATPLRAGARRSRRRACNRSRASAEIIRRWPCRAIRQCDGQDAWAPPRGLDGSVEAREPLDGGGQGGRGHHPSSRPHRPWPCSCAPCLLARYAKPTRSANIRSTSRPPMNRGGRTGRHPSSALALLGGGPDRHPRVGIEGIHE